MSKDATAKDDPPGAPARGEATRAAQAERDARLAAALRANLRRRKAQSRAREDAAKPDATKPDETPDGG